MTLSRSRALTGWANGFSRSSHQENGDANPWWLRGGLKGVRFVIV